jgi:hypothetical protein
MQALRLPAARGWHWIAEGFRLFRRNSPLLTLLALTYWLFFFLIFIIPFVGPIAANIALQALSVTVMNGCRAVDQGRSVPIDIVWSGFKRNLPSLLRLGVLYLAGEVAAASILLALFGGSLMDIVTLGKTGGETEMQAQTLLAFLYAALALTLPLVLAFWFAPLLVAWNDLGALKALFFSVVAVFRNWRAFGIYGGAALLATAVAPGVLRAAVASSPFLLATASVAVSIVLVFVVMPTLFASVYVSYREVFAESGGDAVGA